MNIVLLKLSIDSRSNGRHGEPLGSLCTDGRGSYAISFWCLRGLYRHSK